LAKWNAHIIIFGWCEHILMGISCGYSGVEKLISDYEQTVGTTKTDLNLKIVSLKKVDTWIVGDTIRKRKQADRAVGIQKPDSVYYFFFICVITLTI